MARARNITQMGLSKKLGDSITAQFKVRGKRLTIEDPVPQALPIERSLNSREETRTTKYGAREWREREACFETEGED
ncbi:hypothetical protein SERLA73DRAFT_70305 [Serpula lacrymans var. lacrymans S7.3]|uniref:Uncharacterized protein n=1 Tax=Serpula lacrymans var. lacrymans (strain S7.3) TaxID=936435 RepID=F8PMI7_SERL3|nr:hypothetical protein SERLA73DRAFT_70305 [Serpula lacrymans var. lacrymans S7.3]